MSVGVGVDVGVEVGVGVRLAVTVAVGERVGASAADIGIFFGRNQANVMPMKVTREPKTTQKPGFFCKGSDKIWFLIPQERDAGVVDAGSSRDSGMVTHRRAHRSAA